MRLFRDFAALPAATRGAVVALGNFDGVHRGHQAVVNAARAAADRAGAPLAVLTFEPHPRRLFSPQAAPFRLTPLRAKLRLLADLGVEHVFALRFNRALSQMSAERFAQDILIQAISARHVVVGYDFVFGHQRRGNAELLGGVADAGGFEFTCVEPVSGGGRAETYSSTLVRRYLAGGEPARAASLLGRDWEIEGRVRMGRQLGRTIGVPTANIALGRYLRPAFGVYACHVGVPRGGGTAWIPGVANIGRRPTVDGEGELLEVHLFDFAEDLYGQRLRVGLVDHLRGEAKFDGLPALKAQIARDMEQARQILAYRGWSGSWPDMHYAAAIREPGAAG
ncbi:MAG: bifunctional riboflavin kinase/FAD synthetase [Alphaproteobacteria bacterium]